MRIDPRWALAAVALTVAGCDKGGPTGGPIAEGNSAAAVPAVKAPNGQDWAETVVATPEQGMRIGNPDAKVKLVEYGALTCSHCAAFSAEGGAPLMQMVRSGNVSWEFRTFILNGIDVPMSLMARCQGPGPFFKLIEQVYAEQPNWIAKVQAITPADQAAIQAMPPEQQPLGVARAAQLTTFFGARGLPEAKAAACLADKGGIAALETIAREGQASGITGTPFFTLNGEPVKDVASWDLLKPKLDAAIAG